jgi:hypothetical protein
MLPPTGAVNHVEQSRGIRRELPPRIHRRPTLLLSAAGKYGLCLYWIYWSTESTVIVTITFRISQNLHFYVMWWSTSSIVAIVCLVHRASQIVHLKAPEMESYRSCLQMRWCMHVECEICINIRVSSYKQERHLYRIYVKWIRTGFCVVHEVGSFYFCSGE